MHSVHFRGYYSEKDGLKINSLMNVIYDKPCDKLFISINYNKYRNRFKLISIDGSSPSDLIHFWVIVVIKCVNHFIFADNPKS